MNSFVKLAKELEYSDPHITSLNKVADVLESIRNYAPHRQLDISKVAPWFKGEPIKAIMTDKGMEIADKNYNRFPIEDYESFLRMKELLRDS